MCLFHSYATIWLPSGDISETIHDCLTRGNVESRRLMCNRSNKNQISQALADVGASTVRRGLQRLRSNIPVLNIVAVFFYTFDLCAATARTSGRRMCVGGKRSPYLFMFFKMSLRSTQTIKCGCNKSGSYLWRLRPSLNNNEAFILAENIHPDLWRGKNHAGLIQTMMLRCVMRLRAVVEMGHV